MVSARQLAVFSCLTLLLPALSRAQTPNGTLTGRVTDTTAKAVAGASVQVAGTPLGTRTREDGSFRIDNVPAGSHALRVRLLGFAPESTTVTITGGATTAANVRLRPLAVSLQSVLVVAHRLGETKAAALDRQQVADNLVTVLSGDEIRALPNGNAAEAAGRMPDVSLERDEGEGKFVQIRGTEPRLSNVTIDGVHVPGTEQGDRIVKLDDVPSDILAAIEVSKTLTADMDADAIGGSVNLVTKTPEGRPQGYVAAQYGRMSLLDRDVGQGTLTYGGRVGVDGRLGFLLGGSLDRNNRAINDVEPAWSVDGAGRSIPVEWSQRDYTYYRTRYGVGADLDYRVNDHSTVYLKGLWSLFKNHGTRYVYVDGVQALELGRRDRPDLLSISLSTTDAIGHAFGPDSREIHDQLLHVDRWLGQFLDSLARLVPTAGTVVVLTGDHGVTPLPEYTVTVRHRPGGRVWLGGLARRAAAVLRSRFQADFGLEFDSGLLVADVGALRSRGIDVDSLAGALAAEAASLPGVARVFTRRTLALAPPSDWNAELWRHMIPPDYGWLLCGVTTPGYVWSAGGLDAEHGSTNPEDVAVPIAFYGASIAAQRIERPVSTVDIAPTLAALLGVPPTEPLDGHVLPEVLSHPNREGTDP